MIFAQSGELSSILQRGLEDIETLSQVDRFRFHLGFSTTLRHYETAFLAWKSGLLARQSWTGMEASLRQLLAFGGVRRYWDAQQNQFSDEFRAHVNALELQTRVAEGAPRDVASALAGTAAQG